jgi:hypothetical protein
MGELHRPVVCLRLFGDDLDPDEVTAGLGTVPTVSARKGDIRTTSTGVEIVAPKGSWRLEVNDSRPNGLDGQIVQLLEMLTDDMSIWHDLTSRFDTDLSCGLFMQERNEGFALASKTLANLGSRGLDLDFAIYGPIGD